ncbi:hypothetical protein AGR5A_Lc100017 [Agrobacterium genomosp. 5 str. CFBP 6626]|nr:hypothetical protein AGR5A_Lc100017 [Agrobacterium genomosp. 5 str. CFBP 6626]
MRVCPRLDLDPWHPRLQGAKGIEGVVLAEITDYSHLIDIRTDQSEPYRGRHRFQVRLDHGIESV